MDAKSITGISQGILGLAANCKLCTQSQHGLNCLEFKKLSLCRTMWNPEPCPASNPQEPGLHQSGRCDSCTLLLYRIVSAIHPPFMVMRKHIKASHWNKMIADSQSTAVVRKSSLKSMQSSHVPCVVGAKNLSIGRQVLSYVCQNNAYLGIGRWQEAGTKTHFCLQCCCSHPAVKVRYICPAPLLIEHPDVTRRKPSGGE